MKAEAADLLARAEAADQADIPGGMSVPDELARRGDWLRKLAEARARERFVREKPEYEARMAARAAKAAETGKKPSGRVPAPPVETPLPNEQINLTDEESRIMPVAGGGFGQCYNAQAAVAAGSLLVVATDVVQAPNDKQQVAPMLDRLAAPPDGLGVPVGWDRSGDRARARGTLAEPGGALCSSPGGAGGPHTARGNGASATDTTGPRTLRPAQADTGAGVRHH